MLAAGTRLGVFEVVSVLGVGGMGEVYRATDTKLKREVAIKVLPDAFARDPDRLARFQREAEVLATLNHPNIAQIHGLEESGGITALVMELVEGPTLADHIAQGAIPIDEALPIAKQTAEALEAAHERGIIHRDLKPANIKLRPDGVVKVLDFGLAKLVGPAEAGHYVLQGGGAVDRSVRLQPDLTAAPTITSPAMMTQAGMILGTAAYMSPEQAKGREADKRSDLWAFGCVLYEMVTGKRAFAGADVSEVLASVLAREPDWTALPAEVPPALRALLRRCLEKDRRERVADISTALFVLKEQASLAAPVGMTSVARLPRRSLWRHVAVLTGGALVVAVLGGALVWFAARPAPTSVVRTTISTSGSTALTLEGTDRDVAITPDGSRVVYRGDRQLLVRALDQLEPTVLSGLGPGPGPRGVFISPDGQWVGFFNGSAMRKVLITLGHQ